MQDIGARRRIAEQRPNLDLLVQRAELVQQFPLFADLDKAALEHLSGSLQTRYVGAGRPWWIGTAPRKAYTSSPRAPSKSRRRAILAPGAGRNVWPDAGAAKPAQAYQGQDDRALNSAGAIRTAVSPSSRTQPDDSQGGATAPCAAASIPGGLADEGPVDAEQAITSPSPDAAPSRKTAGPGPVPRNILMNDAGGQWVARGHPFQRRNKAMLVDANGYLLGPSRTSCSSGLRLADPGDGWPRGAAVRKSPSPLACNDSRPDKHLMGRPPGAGVSFGSTQTVHNDGTRWNRHSSMDRVVYRAIISMASFRRCARARADPGVRWNRRSTGWSMVCRRQAWCIQNRQRSNSRAQARCSR